MDDYLDEFRDLITDAGYTDSKTIVVKFWRGLDSEIQDAIATMPYGRPSDTSLNSWYEAAQNIDQNQAANRAFNSACQLSTPDINVLPTLIPNPILIVHKHIDSLLKTDIRTLAQELREELMEKQYIIPKKLPIQSKPVKATLLFASPNRFEALSEICNSKGESPESQISECTLPAVSIPPSITTPVTPKVRKSKWEKALPEKLTIAAVEGISTSLNLKVEIETTDTAEKKSVVALLDSGATGEFIDRQYAKSCWLNLLKLTRPIPVYNVDGSPNEAGSITEAVTLLLRYKNHSEQTTFCITNLGKQKLLLGHSWLRKHNPEINWETGEVKMLRCPPNCCLGCRDELRQERIAHKAEARRIEICSIRPLPEVDHDSEHDSEPSLDPADESISVETGDRILATGLLPPPSVNIRASSTISQRLAEAFQTNEEALTPIPGYLKEFTAVFSKQSFDVLPESKEWDHAVELIPESKPSGCKVYPLSPAEQKELDAFLKENLETGRI